MSPITPTGVERFVENFNARDVDALCVSFADAVTWQDSWGMSHEGKGPMGDVVRGWFASFDVRYTVRSIVVSGNTAGLLYEGEALSKGTEKSAVWDGALFFVYDDAGKIATAIELFPTESLKQQFGF